MTNYNKLPVEVMAPYGFHMVYIGLSGWWSLPKNSAFWEFVTDSETARRDLYTYCAPTMWSPMNFVT